MRPRQKSSTGVLLPRLTRVILCAVLKSLNCCSQSTYEFRPDRSVIRRQTRNRIRRQIRSRGSNPNTASPNPLTGHQLTKSEIPLSGNSQETGGTSWLDLTSIDIELRYVIEHWNLLSDEGKQRIADTCRNNDRDK